jgi:hypothetical protein
MLEPNLWLGAARQAGARVVGIMTAAGFNETDVDLAVADFTSPELEPWLAAQQKI